MYKNNKAITLTVLTITIIVIIILAGISISALIGDNGLIRNSTKIKVDAEIAKEKEIIETASISTLRKSYTGRIEKIKLQEEMDKTLGTGKSKVYEDNNKFVIEFAESDNFYVVDDKVENIEKIEIEFDPYPGEIDKDLFGNTLTGDSDDPFEINCIEDLCAFSNSVTGGNFYTGKYISLKRDLDFKSDLSYVNGNIPIDGNIRSCNSADELKQLLTDENGSGFYPIGQFRGKFHGNFHEIRNIYENHDNQTNQGLFSSTSGVIIDNLTIQGTFKGGNNTGGIVGRSDGNLTINNCVSKVNISSTANDAGGILAAIYNGTNNITNSINYGDVSGGRFIGGIVGFNWKTLNIYNCINYESTLPIYGKYLTYVPTLINNFNMKDVKAEDYNDFVEERNDYITTNGALEGIDTTRWAKWQLNEEELPFINIYEIWDSKKWIDLVQ